MKYAIDRIENNIAILEEITTKEKKEVPTEILPKEIKEGTILIYEEDQYRIDNLEEEQRRKRIMEKFKKLKK